MEKCLFVDELPFKLVMFHSSVRLPLVCPIILAVMYNPPTPAICRGSAPEKKWLCGAFGGPAACPMAICRVLSRLPLNVSRRPWRPSSMSFGHLPGAFLEIFFWFQKATLGSRLPLNVSRRPWRPSSMSFGHLPGAFLTLFFWFQKATVGSRLPLNVSRRPWRPSSVSFGHLPGAFLEIFFWYQKATLGSRLPLNVSRRHRLPLNPSRRPWRPSSMSFGHLPGAFLEIFFWFFPGDFLLVSESNVRQ